MDSNAISRLENGLVSPNLNTIVALSIALGKYPYELVKPDVDFVLNSHFSARSNKKVIETTKTIRLLADSGHFHTKRSVAEVIEQSRTLYE